VKVEKQTQLLGYTRTNKREENGSWPCSVKELRKTQFCAQTVRNESVIDVHVKGRFYNTSALFVCSAIRQVYRYNGLR